MIRKLKSIEEIIPLALRRRHRRITFEGVMFVILTVLIGIAALNTGTNLLYLILSMMLCLLLLSGVVSSLTLSRLNVQRIAPRQAVANEPLLVHLDIKNKKPIFSSYSLQFTDLGKENEKYGAGYVFHISPRRTQRISYYLLFPRRGLYELERIRISSRFPFGLFERSIDIVLPHQVIVYPQIVDVRSLVKGHSIEIGEIESPRKGMGTSLYGLREYTLEDSARLIHWKVSARASEIMVREFEKEEKKRVSIIINNHISDIRSVDQQLREYFERAIIIGASIAKLLLDNGYNVQVITASGKIPFGMGTSHIHRIMRALALLELTEEPPKVSLTITHPEAESAIIYLQFGNHSTPPLKRENIEIIDVRQVDVSKLLRKSLTKDTIATENTYL